jgi:hypothetical protein
VFRIKLEIVLVSCSFRYATSSLDAVELILSFILSGCFSFLVVTHAVTLLRFL